PRRNPLPSWGAKNPPFGAVGSANIPPSGRCRTGTESVTVRATDGKESPVAVKGPATRHGSGASPVERKGSKMSRHVQRLFGRACLLAGATIGVLLTSFGQCHAGTWQVVNMGTSVYFSGSQVGGARTTNLTNSTKGSSYLAIGRASVGTHGMR